MLQLENLSMRFRLALILCLLGAAVTVATALLLIATVAQARHGEVPLQASLEALPIVSIVLLASVAISILAAVYLWRQCINSSQVLAQTVRQIAGSKDFTLRAPQGRNGETSEVIRNFNSMLDEIEGRNEDAETTRQKLVAQIAESEIANEELQVALDRLQETQLLLVQKEKMASLGGLVAGVAHEINTPLGVGVTATSYLETQTRKLQNLLESGNLSAEEIGKYADHASQSTDIIMSNLKRAAELINSFKEVAVDQTSGDKRTFNLGPYLNEILISLRPKFREGQHEVEIHCPDELEINSYPGAISQIITNLITNSLTHGFQNMEKGKITIQAGKLSKHIRLIYRDNGIGISKEDQARIFDPFFTTKRGSGGSGLGMHVVYNLVTQTMGGAITMQSTPGEGVAFYILFPSDEETG